MDVIRLAVEDLNEEAFLPLNISLDIRSSEPPAKNHQSVATAMLQGSLMVSSNVLSDTLNDITVYKTFIRTISSNDIAAQQFLSYIRTMGWRRISILYSEDGLGRSAFLAMSRNGHNYGVRIINSHSFFDIHTSGDFDNILQNIRDSGSYINVIFANGDYLLHALNHVMEAGMFNLPYVWIVLNDVISDKGGFIPGSYPLVHANWDGLIMASLLDGFARTDAFYAFRDRWTNLDANVYPGAGQQSVALINEIVRAYSCVRYLALGFKNDIQLAKQRGLTDEYIRQELLYGSYPRTIGNLTALFFSTFSYDDGPLGKITLDSVGNINNVPILFYQRQNNDSIGVARSSIPNDGKYSTTLLSSHVWPGLPVATASPTDSPEWLLQSIPWSSSTGKSMFVLAVTGASLCVVLIPLIVYLRNNPVVKSTGATFCVLEVIAMAILTVVVIICIFPYIVYVVAIQPQAVFTTFDGKEAILCRGTTRLTESPARLALQIVRITPLTILMIATAFLSYRTRNMYTKWNESYATTCTVYNILICHIIYICTFFTSDTGYGLSVIIQNIAMLLGMYVALAALFGVKIVHMIRLAIRERKQRASLDLQETNALGTSAPSMNENDQARLQDTLQQFEFISTERGDTTDVRNMRRRRAFFESRPCAHSDEFQRTAAFIPVPGGPQVYDYLLCSLFGPPAQAERSANTPMDVLRQRIKSQGSGQEIVPIPDVNAKANAQKDSIFVPVLIKRNRLYDRVVRRWRSMHVIAVPALTTIMLSDCHENYTETCIYTDVKSVNNSGHSYLQISCLYNMQLKLEFPSGDIRDQWHTTLGQFLTNEDAVLSKQPNHIS
ncbi:hypothetical protein BG004_002082 [Podila humilis]|nr:hypothetical protein BG004_002082 [Podila humilis]